MPHRCRECTRVIADESESLLSGCPGCGNTSWEYVESMTGDDTSNEDESQQVARTEFVDEDSLPSPSVIEALQSSPDDQTKPESEPTVENNEPTPAVETVNNIEEVQQRLNEQYDGIRVVRQGRYEINLTQLYRGHDYVIEIGDDGAYTVKRASESPKG